MWSFNKTKYQCIIYILLKQIFYSIKMQNVKVYQIYQQVVNNYYFQHTFFENVCSVSRSLEIIEFPTSLVFPDKILILLLPLYSPKQAILCSFCFLKSFGTVINMEYTPCTSLQCAQGYSAGTTALTLMKSLGIKRWC